MKHPLKSKFAVLAAALIMAGLTASCGSGNKNEDEHHTKSLTEIDKEHAQEDQYGAMSGQTKIEIPNPAPFEGVGEGVKTSVTALFEKYIKVKDALVADNYKDANMASKEFLTVLDAAKADGLSAEGKTYFDEMIAKMRKDAQHIIETEDIAHQRDHFFTFSQDMYAALKAFSANKSTAYLQHCPMAFENNGAFWVSDKSEVLNPYFGSSMLKCGTVKETLEAKK